MRCPHQEEVLGSDCQCQKKFRHDVRTRRWRSNSWYWKAREIHVKSSLHNAPGTARDKFKKCGTSVKFMTGQVIFSIPSHRTSIARVSITSTGQINCRRKRQRTHRKSIILSKTSENPSTCPSQPQQTTIRRRCVSDCGAFAKRRERRRSVLMRHSSSRLQGVAVPNCRRNDKA